MRLSKIVSFLYLSLLFVGVVLAISTSETSAAWWNKSSESPKASQSTQTAGKKADAGSVANAGNVTSTDKSGRFMSYAEQQELAREKEKTQKGLFIRFPWTKKEEETIEDPFGEVEDRGPTYQDMSALGITQSTDTSVASQHEASPPESSFDTVGVPNNLHDATLAVSQSTPQTPAPAVGSAVEMPMMPNMQPVPEPQVVQEKHPGGTPKTIQPDMILKQMPSLTADTSKMAGDGIQFYEHGQVLAQVGSQVILSGEIVGQADRIMEENRSQIPEQYWDMQREMIIRTLLAQTVERKLIYCDVMRNVPPEGIKQNIELIDNLFEDSELPHRMEEAGIRLRDDYEKKLAEEGTCILKQKYLYREIVLCQQWMMKIIPQNPSVSYREISDYYYAHPHEFEVQPRARWEELVIRKARFYSRDEAYQEIVRIGSMVAVQRKPFEEVAQEFSHGVTAKSGGKHDWIKPGQLASKVLENAIFNQPIGELSPNIVEDDKCFYIVRVLERDPFVKKPIGDVQKEIFMTIKESKLTKIRQEYFDKLRREIPVFTVFDGIPSPEERLKAEQAAMR